MSSADEVVVKPEVEEEVKKDPVTIASVPAASNPKPEPASDDEDLPRIDSSDEDEGSEANEYEEDGFVVNSDEEVVKAEVDLDDEDEAPKSGSRLKRLRKGGKRKRFELDQEDLDLVAEHQGLMPSSKKRKAASDDIDDPQTHFIPKSRPNMKESDRGESTSNAMDNMEEDPEFDSDDDDFLADEDDEGFGERPPKAPRRKKKERQFLSVNYEQFEDANAIYDDDWVRSRFEGEDDLFDTSAFDGPKPTEDKFAKYKKQYDPQTLKDLYLTAEDEVIKVTDAPERYQLLFPNRPAPSDEELYKEATWIADILKPYAAPEMKVEEKMKDVLTFLLCSHFEMPFILAYRKEFWMSVFTSEELWKILELDIQWFGLEMRKASLKKAIADQDAMTFDARLMDIEGRLETTTDESVVLDLTDYHQLHYTVEEKSATDKLVDDLVAGESKKPQYKKIARTDVYSMAKSSNIGKFLPMFGLAPAELVKKISITDVGAMEVEFRNPDVSPLDAANDYISHPFFAKPQQVLDGARAMFVKELSSHPIFRARCSEFFGMYAVVSTSATEKGRLYIDLLHPYANIRNLKHKVISAFQNTSTFLLICKAVDEGLIKLDMAVPKDRVDIFIGQLGNSFQLGALFDDKDSSSYLWAVQRRMILVEALHAVLPKLTARTRSKLRHEASQVVLAEYETKLEALVRAGGIPLPASKKPKKKSRYDDDTTDPADMATILSICLSDPAQGRDTIAMCSIVDKNGEIVDTLTILAQLRVEDNIALRNFLRRHLPFASAVGVDTPFAHKFFGQFKDLVKTFVEEEHAPDIQVLEMPLDVAMIFQASQRAEREFASLAASLPSTDAAYLIRRCVSVARRLLDPLLEISGLVNNDDDIFGLSLHPLKKMINPIVLKRRIEQVFVKVINEIGVDINRILNHSWMHHTLQFVAGLGPRKAAAFLEGMTRAGGRIESRNALKEGFEGSELSSGESWGPVVWDNAVPFIKISKIGFRHDDYNPLDGTRIHPIAYSMARKIGDDLTTMGHIRPSENFVDAIARNNDLIKHVDLNAMIEKLKSKQVDKGLTITALVEELKHPFADPRKYSPIPSSVIFDRVVGEGTLKIGMSLTVRVTYEGRKTNTYEVQLVDYRINGRIPMEGPDAPNEPLVKGQTTQAQLVGIDKDLYEVQLSGQVKDTKWSASKVENNDPWLAEEDPVVSSGPAVEVKKPLYTHPIVHPKFSNKTQAEVEEDLANKKEGAYLIHPTSHKQYLTITSKFYFGTFAHVSVTENEDKSLTIDKETYENLDDLIVRYMDPRTMNLEELSTHPTFKILNSPDMKSTLQREKQDKPSRAPYYIGPCQDKPGFFVLYYIPGSTTVQKEFVRIVPEGFKYRSRVHKTVNRLIAWFKKHFNDPSYMQQMRQQQQPVSRPSYPSSGYPSHHVQPPHYGQTPQWNPAPSYLAPVMPPMAGMGYAQPPRY